MLKNAFLAFLLFSDLYIIQLFIFLLLLHQKATMSHEMQNGVFHVLSVHSFKVLEIYVIVTHYKRLVQKTSVLLKIILSMQ